MRDLVAAVALFFGAAPLLAPLAAETPGPPDATLSGTITGDDHQSYVTKAIEVPAGVAALSVDFSYDRTQGTVIDLGLMEGDRLRGWSGGNKSRFLLGEARATPSYLPGPVAGRPLRLLLGIPNARPGSRTEWRAEIRFERPSSAPLVQPPLKSEAGWYRGDLHSHTGHSDGTCPNSAGARVPCPVYRTVEAAARAGLDFVAVTDHNTVSHLSELEALQPAFPDLLLIPGQEVTTFQGHANVIGATRLAEFRVGTPAAPDGASWSRAVGEAGGIVSINHPGLPSGESCMGCGWTLAGIDWSRIHAVEVINGGALAAAGGRAETRLSGIPFWEARLAEGWALAPVAGSDNHDASLLAPDPRAIGRTATVVWADSLSVSGLVEGIKRGRVFVDLDADRSHILDLSAQGPAGTVAMGGRLRVKRGAAIPFQLRVAGCRGCTARLIVGGTPLPGQPVGGDDATIAAQVRVTKKNWVRAEARQPSGELAMISAAILVEIEN